MRIQTATIFYKNNAWVKAIRFVDQLWESSALASWMDDALRGRRVARWLKKGSALDPRIYDEPDADLFDDHIKAIQAMLAKSEPGLKVKALFVWGRLRSRKAKAIDRRVGVFAETEAGDFRLFSYRIQSGLNGHESWSNIEEFTRWMATEKIAMIRQANGQWHWLTGQSAQSIFTIPHPVKAVESECIAQAQFDIVRHLHGATQIWRREKDGEEQRKKTPDQKKRLAKLLPEDKIALAIEIENARAERQELARETGLASEAAAGQQKKTKARRV